MGRLVTITSDVTVPLGALLFGAMLVGFVVGLFCGFMSGGLITAASFARAEDKKNGPTKKEVGRPEQSRPLSHDMNSLG